ncbi:MAG: phosphatidylserine decarboxylase [Campylobacterota bacterium]|nr:phosphatidylserine decarboxylase [Campylobacterota bacterium]
MKANNLLPVAKEGWRYLGGSLVFSLLFFLVDLEFLGFIAFIIFTFFIYSFRNPERQLPMFEKSSVLSPSDGVVRAIVELEDSEYTYRVDIESSLLDVAILRAPINGNIEAIVQHNGTRVSHKSKLFSDINEKVTLTFSDEKNNSVKITHTLKQSFSPLFIDVSSSDNIYQTARYGLMLNGITSICLPRNFRINTSVGKEVKAAESLMGYFS